MMNAPMPVERILFPTDFSSFSVQAFRHALALALRFRARLTVAHVIPRLPPLGEADALYVRGSMAPEDRRRVDEQMHAFLAPAREARIDHQTEVCVGDPWRELVSLAGEMPADLVVMGTHGRGGLDRLLLGSVAEKLIRRLPCPVLTVCHEEGRVQEAPGSITRVLCATDFSETSAEALRCALTLADQARGEVTLLHVVEAAPEVDGPALLLPYLGPLREDLAAAAEAQLDALIDGASSHGVRIEPLVTFGRAYKEILRIAAQERADLVVVGAQGHGVIEHMLSGSNAQHLIRGARCPVLTVRPSRAARKGRTAAAGSGLAAAVEAAP